MGRLDNKLYQTRGLEGHWGECRKGSAQTSALWQYKQQRAHCEYTVLALPNHGPPSASQVHNRLWPEMHCLLS